MKLTLSGSYRMPLLITGLALIMSRASAQSPQIQGLDGTVINHLPSNNLALLDDDGDLTVTPGTSPSNHHVTVSAWFSAGSVPGEDQLTIRSHGYVPDQVIVDGTNVYINNDKVAVIRGGSGNIRLMIQFTANQSYAVISQVMRNLAYINTKPGSATIQPRQIRVSLTDGFGGNSNEATVTINVQAGSRQPTARDFYYAIPPTPPYSTAVGSRLVELNTDAANQPAYALVELPTKHGALGFTTASGQFTYTPNPGFTGLDSFTYRTYYNGAPSTPGTVVLHVGATNVPPAAADYRFSVYRDQVFLLPESSSILHAQNDPNSGSTRIFNVAWVVTQPPNGTVVMGRSGDFTYTPNPGFTGTDVFTYSNCDAQGLCAIGTIRMEVISNYAPLAANDLTLSDGNPATGNVLTNDQDVEGNALTASLVTAPVNGTVVLNADGSFTYTPNNNFNGLDSLIYQVCDNGRPSFCDTATLSLRVSLFNRPPVITAPAQQDVTEDTATAINTISFADPDAGGADVTVMLRVPSGRGVLEALPSTNITVKDTSSGTWLLRGSIARINTYIAGDSITYTPPANENGTTVPLNIYISDQGNTGTDPGTSGTATDEIDEAVMNLNILGVNDAPVLTVPGDQAVPLNTKLVFSAANSNLISVDDVDAAAGALEMTLAVNSGTLTLPVTTGLTFLTGAGNNESTFTFTGTLTNINAALAGLEFTAPTGFIGEVTLQADVDDQQNTGSGTALTDSRQVRILAGPQEPIITAVTAQTANGRYKTGDNIVLVVQFNKSVTVTGSPLLLLETGTNDQPATYLSGSGSTALTFRYTVQNGDQASDLDYTATNALQLNNGTIQGTAGNLAASLTLATPGATGSLGAAADIVIDGVAPAITALQGPAAGRYKTGDELQFTATLSEDVVINTPGDAPVLAVTIGSTVVNATFLRMQGRELIFTHTIADGMFDADGITPAATLQLPAGKIQDAAGNDLQPAIPGAGVLTGVLVDAIAPVVTAGQVFTLPENAAAGAAAGTVAATDAGALLPLQQWQITQQTNPAAFTIAPSTGVLTVADPAALNFAGQPAHDITVTVSDGLQASAPVAVRINLQQVNRPPTLDAVSGVSACTGVAGTVQLTGITPGPESGQTVSLSISAAADNFSQLSVADNGNGTATVTYALKTGVTGETRVTVAVQDNGGTQFGGADTFTREFGVTAATPAAISITAQPGTGISKGETAQLTASGAATYQWQAADGIVSGLQGATLSVRPFQAVTYRVTGTTADGCTSEGSIEITVKEDFKLQATNVITPNGDGINDRWVIRNIDAYPDNEVKIFDRSGRMVYNKKGYLNEWGGTANGNPLQEGTYYFILDLGAGQPQFKGFITLVRDRN